MNAADTDILSISNTQKQVIELRNANLFMTMSEIANRVGVSRQRVHQILKKEGIPTGHRIRTKQIKKISYNCPMCGTVSSFKFCSDECKKKWQEIPVVCTRCGKLFTRDRHQFFTNYLHHNDGLFCSKVCAGKWYGEKYGFKNYPNHSATWNK